MDMKQLLKRPIAVRRVSPPTDSQPYAVLRVPASFYEALGAPRSMALFLGDDYMVLIPVPEEKTGEKEGGRDATSE